MGASLKKFSAFLAAVKSGTATDLQRTFQPPFADKSFFIYEFSGLLDEMWIDWPYVSAEWIKPIHVAAFYGNVDALELLLPNGYDLTVETQRWDWQTMHLAAMGGSTEALQWLMNRGASSKPKDRYGKTPMHHAASNGHVAAMQCLIDHGASPTAVDKNGCTPMHFAACNGHIAAMKCLVDHGASPESENKWNERPLHFACQSGHESAVRWLVCDIGCIIDGNHKNELTPTAFAKRNGHDRCVATLSQEQEERKSNEYSIWHFKDMSVVVRKFKIFCISSVIETVKMNVRPIDAPVILCGICNFTDDCYANTVGPVLHLLSKHLRYSENIVVNSGDRMEDVVVQLERCRGWKCALWYPNTRKNVPLELSVVEYLRFNTSAELYIRIETAIKWMDTGPLSVNYCDNAPLIHSEDYAESFFLWCRGDRTLRQIKSVITESFQGNILYAIHQKKEDIKSSKYFLKRLATNKADLLLFLSGDESISGSTSVDELISNKQLDITVRQKFSFNSVDFISVPEAAMTRKMSECVSQRPFVFKPIFPGYPLVMGLSHGHSSVGQIKADLINHLQIEDVMLLHNGRMPKDHETLPQLPDDVTDYAAIISCPTISEKARIGSGAFGTVFKCKETNSDYFVLKVLDRNNSACLSNTELHSDIISELIIASKVPPHDRVIAYHAFYKDIHLFGCDFCIRMPFMDQGSLGGLLKENGPLQERHIRHFSNQILEGLNHLHRNKVMHRDLKGQNVLIDKDSNVKLCDFGLSRHLNDLASSDVARGHVWSYVGTPNWMAPEVMGNPSVYSIKADIWSFGATIVEMITGKPPYDNEPPYRMYSKIMEGIIEYEPPSPLSDEQKSFVDICLKKEPDDRPSCSDLLRHVFLTQ